MQTTAQVMALGFTRQVFIDFGSVDLTALISPMVDVGGAFRAFDIDTGEWITVYGWLASVENDE